EEQCGHRYHRGAHLPVFRAECADSFSDQPGPYRQNTEAVAAGRGDETLTSTDGAGQHWVVVVARGVHAERPATGPRREITGFSATTPGQVAQGPGALPGAQLQIETSV